MNQLHAIYTPLKIYRYNDVTVFLHSTDLPKIVRDEIVAAGYVAVDTETAGLRLGRDRLCLAQLSYKPREAHCVQIPIHANTSTSPNLCEMLASTDVQKIFHFARFDIGILYKTYNVLCENVWCTRIGSRICRTNTDSHSLLTLCHSLLGIKLDKEMCHSDWTEDNLDDMQLRYAANDVIYLRELQEKLTLKLKREGRLHLAERAMGMIPPRVELDVAGWAEEDILAFRTKY